MRTVTLLVFALGCAAAPKVEPIAVQTEASSELRTEEVGLDDAAACLTACERESMARAVAWEQVQADCQRSCTNDAKVQNGEPRLLEDFE